MNPTLEIAVFSLEAARTAAESGADRLELCASYAEGGISPSPVTLEMIKEKFRLPVFVMVRPRGGNFIYSPAEAEAMVRETERFEKAGADGIVSGALTADDRIDENILGMLRSATNLPFTFHRAFDSCTNREEAMETLIRYRCSRILTSGGAPDAVQGVKEIAALNEMAAGRIVIIPGGGIRSGNIAEIAAATRCREFHASAILSSGKTAFGGHPLPDPGEIQKLKHKLI